MVANMAKEANSVILARVSSKAQEDEGYSLDSQLKLLQSYCSSKELNVIKVFRITETASKEQSRKIFHEMFDFIAKENIYHLVVEKTDRFTRNFRDAVAIDEWLEKDAQRRLHCVKENILLHKEAKSDVKFMWNIHVSVAKKYADNLREESMKGWAEKLAQGWMPAPPPPGYKTAIENGKKIHVPDERTKPLMQRAFQLYLEPSYSIMSICDELELMGITTRKGRYYHKSQVQHILTNPYYIGIIRFNGKEYPGAHEPIIDKDLFDKVQQKMRGKRPSRYQQHNPVFKNMITCNYCNRVVTWQLQKGHYYGTCQRSQEACKGRKLLREDVLEAEVSAMLKRLVSPAENVIDWVASAMREKYKGNIETNSRLVTSIQTQLNRVNRMDSNLYDDKLAGEVTQEKYDRKHTELLAERKQLEEQLAHVDQTLDQLLEQKLVLLELSQKAAELYPKKTPEQKRLIITKLFQKLTYTDEAVSVIYTNFSRAIAQNVLQTNNLLGGKI